MAILWMVIQPVILGPASRRRLPGPSGPTAGAKRRRFLAMAPCLGHGSKLKLIEISSIYGFIVIYADLL